VSGVASGGGRRLSCSVIVPCWNDANALRDALPRLTELRGVDEIIVADASNGDDCRALAIGLGVRVVRCAQANRGAQLNAGARVACGDLLLFHHADTYLTQAHIDALHHAMRNHPGLAGGAFHRKFDERHARLRMLEKIARILAERGGTLYGDQSLFVRRETFERLSGFAEIPLMEDIEFSRRLRRTGQTAVLDPPISTSLRHHAIRGAVRTSIRNGVMIALYRLGFPPQRLHAWYYRKPVF
jgi:rSAM/selenodomain-associated transferase 2